MKELVVNFFCLLMIALNLIGILSCFMLKKREAQLDASDSDQVERNLNDDSNVINIYSFRNKVAEKSFAEDYLKVFGNQMEPTQQMIEQIRLMDKAREIVENRKGA